MLLRVDILAAACIWCSSIAVRNRSFAAQNAEPNSQSVRTLPPSAECATKFRAYRAKPVGAVVFTPAAYFMLQPVEDKTPMAFAYEKEAVGEVRRAVSIPQVLAVLLGAAASCRGC
mgnify:CR=1 FL=1